MSLTLIAFMAAILTTGLTSLFAHKLTLLGGAVAAGLFGVLSLLSRRGSIHPIFVVGPMGLCVICLLSAESNVAPGSSAIHVLASYGALLGLAASTPDFSGFCRRLIFFTFAIQVTWVLTQTAMAGRIASWTVTAAASGGNLVAAQIVMTLPLVYLAARDAPGARKLVLRCVVLLGAFSVFCVGSRNGIGSLILLTTLGALFNRKKTAMFACAFLSLIIVFINEILQNAFVVDLLVRFRFLRFEAQNSRSLIWSICSDYIGQSPWLGIGPGISEKVLAVLEINHAHNNIVQVALECGVPAAIIAILLFAALLRLPAVALLRDRDAFICSLPIIGYFLISLTDNPIHHPQTTLLLAAAVNECRQALRRSAGVVAPVGQLQHSPFGSAAVIPNAAMTR